MADIFPVATTISIREAGFDENWLEQQVARNPSALGLGELILIQKQRSQGSGGRLDVLLMDPDAETMYEVELMLGETDETHIIRTIEYWDNEKRRYPQRQHYAVLVAESVSRRFFNVIHILSLNVPFIAIQASIVEVAGQRALTFTKILDTYEEPEDGSDVPNEPVGPEYWNRHAKWTAETAGLLLDAVKPNLPSPQLSFQKHYVAITVGRNNFFFLRKRSGDKSLLGFRIATHLMDEAQQILDDAKLSFVKKGKDLHLVIDRATVTTNSGTFAGIAKLVAKTWGKGE